MSSRIGRYIDVITRPVGVAFYFGFCLCVGTLLKALVKKRTLASDANAPASAADKEPAPPPPPDPPRVSVVIPIYRSRGTLERCLESIMNSNYPENRREIIIVDNNSPDGSREIAERYPVRIVEEKNQGRAYARNRGIEASRGEWIAFTDSDCVVEPGWLSKFASRAREHPEVDIFGGEISSIGLSEEMQRFFEEESILTQNDAISGKMVLFPFVITANAFIRKGVFERVGLFDTALITSEDTEWGWRAHFHGIRMQYCPDVRVSHFHPISPSGLFHQFLEYGINETHVFLKHREHISKGELARRLWIMPWCYRKFMTTVFCRWPVSLILSKRHYKRSMMFLAKEIGYRSGRLLANFEKPETWKWFNLFIGDRD